MTPKTTRRKVIAALASLPLSGSAATTPAPVERLGKSGVLVAYLSRSGNTRVIAGLIQRGLGAELFEIRPALPYPQDYLETVERARRERDDQSLPALETDIPGFASYQVVYLGFPVWGGTAPSLIRTLLDTHDFTGKTLVPFITHGGYDVGSSRSVLVAHARGARVEPPFVMEADQERRTMEQVNHWLQQAQA